MLRVVSPASIPGEKESNRRNALSSACLSYREKGNLSHSLQVTQQQAEELRQELEKLQAAQEELRRQHTQLEDEQEDTVQEGARARRDLERRWVAHLPPRRD